MKFVKSLIIILSIQLLLASDESFFLKPKASKAESNANNSTNNSTEDPEKHNGYCFMKIQNYFYDLTSLNQQTPFQLKDKNGKFISFNFCSNVQTQCGYGGLVVNTEKCKFFAGQHEEERAFSVLKENNQTSVNVKLPEGDVCMTYGNMTVRYQTSYKINCAKTLFAIDPSTKFDSNSCTNTIVINSKYGK
jgi:hypothetical protein